MNELVEYLITIGGKTYSVQGTTRAKAVAEAARQFRKETGARYTISVLIASARTKKAQGGRDRYPVVQLEVPE